MEFEVETRRSLAPKHEWACQRIEHDGGPTRVIRARVEYEALRIGLGEIDGGAEVRAVHAVLNVRREIPTASVDISPRGGGILVLGERVPKRASILDVPAEVGAIRAGELEEIRANGPRDAAVRGRMKAPRPSLCERLAVVEVYLGSVAEHAGIRGRARSRARIVELGPRGDIVRPHGLAELLRRGVAPPERVQVPGAVNVDGRGTVSVHDWIVRRPDGHGRCPRLRDMIEVRHVGEEVRREPLKADVRALAGRAVDRGWLGDVPEDRLIVPDGHTVIRSLDARARGEIRRRGPRILRGGARRVGPCGEYEKYGYEERERSPHAARAGHGHFQRTMYRHLSLRPPDQGDHHVNDVCGGHDYDHVNEFLDGRRRAEVEER